MKKAALLMVCGMMALTSCKMNLNGWDTDLIEASDNVVTKEYKLTPFEEVKMNGVGQVELVQSETRNGVVELTAPDNYIELYKFEISERKNQITELFEFFSDGSDEHRHTKMFCGYNNHHYDDVLINYILDYCGA